MSILATYYRVTPNQLDQLLESNEETEAFFDEIVKQSEFDNRLLDLGKSWHSLHFLITGDNSMPGESQAAPPLGKIIAGGIKISYGTDTRYLTPVEVAEIASALKSLSVEVLEHRLDPVTFFNANLYPVQGWDEEELKVLMELYSELVNFFSVAATEGDATIFSMLA